MAKAGFFLRGARGKLAGSVLQKGALGGTVMRENVTPKNPKTFGQSTTRAKFSNVAKFFSPLSMVLEKSWEGKSKAESYQAFLKQAANDAKNSGWCLPKGLDFVPMPYLVSKGTINPIGVKFAENSDFYALIDSKAAANPTTIGQLSAILKEAGYEEGMQVTIVLYTLSEDSTADDMSTWQFAVKYARFIIAEASTVPLTDAIPGIGVSLTIHGDDGNNPTFTANGETPVAGFIIISNFENGIWRRSSQHCLLIKDLMDVVTGNAEASIVSYMNGGGSTVTSDVYLNGGTGTTGGGGSVPETFMAADGDSYFIDSIRYNNGAAEVVSRRIGSNATTINNVMIGTDYLLTASTKGELPASYIPPYSYFDATGNNALQQKLQSLGVAASVF